MRYLVSERRALLAAFFICLGILLLSQTSLFLTPVIISEKSLGLLLLTIALLVIGTALAVKAIRKA